MNKNIKDLDDLLKKCKDIEDKEKALYEKRLSKEPVIARLDKIIDLLSKIVDR